MRFGVLGPLEVEAANGPVVLGGPKERLLLALLLARPNQVVSVDALVGGLWGEQPPPTAAKTLQSHVKRLRHALEPGRARGAAGQVLVTRQPGYLLRVAPGALDAARFEELTTQARRALADGSAQAAGSMLREALGLWRGQAFEEFLDSEFAVAESDRLAELRLGAAEDRLEAELRLGRHREVVAELEGLVRDQPLRERLWAQLLLALYRSGRQADALLAYQRARSVLVEELGIDPGTELRRLHAAILAQDPGLDLPPTAAGAPSPPLPEPLQPVGPPFVGRTAELAWLRAAWTRAAHGRGGMVLLAGGPGMGKTRLAAELAREVHDQGGWVLYGRCGPAPNDPLQPFTQGTRRGGRIPQEVSGAGRSPAPVDQRLAELVGSPPDRRVLLVLDDLHLAQATALEALTAVAATAATRRLLVLGAYREEAASSGLAALMARLDDPSGAVWRRLGPLGQDEVAQVLALYEGEQAARAAAGAVLEATGGVPPLVHQAAANRAQAQAAHQVEEAAGRTASSRGQLRLVQAELANDLVDLQELREHSQQVARPADEGPPGQEKETDDRPAAVICPYKGLARYEAEDAGFFFGRERLVAELVTHLVGAGLVGVVGPSGSGKSSLVRAGLLPALADGVLPGSDRWRQVLVRPGEQPMVALGLALGAGGPGAAAMANGDQGTATADGGGVSDNPAPGRGAANLVLAAAAGAPARLVLVVDQFEEVFTACRDEAERAAFLTALVEAAQATDGPVTVVVAVRADYYGHCAADPSLAGLLAANHLLVGPMDAGELRRAIQLPARRARLRLEPGLAEAMIGEVAEEPGGLPLLSCALLESWQHRQGRTLTLAAYQQAGGVRGAVARLAERAWSGLDADQQQTARRILLRLAGPGEGEAVVRRRVPLEEFTTTQDQFVPTVLEALADQRLVTKTKDAVEVAHEALLREWPRLRGWLEEDVQGRMLHRHLIGVAREWDQSGRDPGELYRGARLTAALDWARDHHADLNRLEREFLEASRAAAEREMADARRRAEREAHTSRRLRGLLAGLAVVLVLALVAGGLALTLRGRAERQALVADAGRLGALAQTEDEIDRSVLLASQAVAMDDTLERRGDLLAALVRNPAATAVMRAHLDGIRPLSLSADGRLLAMGDFNGRIAIFDVRSRRPLPGRFQAQTGVGDLALSPDGSLLAVALQQGGLVQLWDVRSATLRHELQTGLPGVGVSFSPDKRTLVTLSVDDDVAGAVMSRWDIGNGRRLVGPVSVSNRSADALAATPDGARLVVVNGAEIVQVAPGTLRPVRRLARKPPRTGPMVAALSPDGRMVALGAEDGTVQLLDLTTGRFRGMAGRHESPIGGVAFSADGTMLATGGGDRRVIVRDVASGQVRETFQGGEGRFAGLRFSPDGRMLYAAATRSVIVWDLEGAGRLGRPFSVPGPTDITDITMAVITMAVSPDGSVIATPDGPAGDQLTLRELRAPGKVRRRLAPGIGRIGAIAFAPNGRTLALGGERAHAAPVLVDIASGTITQRMTGGHDDGFGTLAFDREGKRILTAGNDGRAIVWDARTGAQLLELRHPEVNDTAAAWSPDGTMVATAGGGGKVVLWRVADRAPVRTWVADPEWVQSVAFSPDGTLLAAAGSGERFATLWEVASGRLVGRLRHPTYVVAVRFDPQGRTLATAATDGTVRLWDLASQRQLGVALPGPDQWSVLAFDPGGSDLVVFYGDGTGLVWDVDPDRWKQRACTIAGGPLTRDEWEELLPGRRYEPACR